MRNFHACFIKTTAPILAGGVLKHRTIQGSSFRPTAIKAGIFVVSSFIVAHAVFGAPKLASRATPAENPWPSLAVSDTIKGEANAIYARLSLPSRQLLANICDQLNRSGTIPSGYFFPEKLALQAIAKWGAKFAENPQGMLNALESRMKGARSMKDRSPADHVAYLNALAQLQFFKTLSAATPEQQKQLLDEAGKTCTRLVQDSP